MPTTAPTPSTAGVIIYGPMGCGKTRNAAALAKLFCKSLIIDDWKPGMMLPNDALALTCQFVDGAIAFDIAFRALPSNGFKTERAPYERRARVVADMSGTRTITFATDHLVQIELALKDRIDALLELIAINDSGDAGMILRDSLDVTRQALELVI